MKNYIMALLFLICWPVWGQEKGDAAGDTLRLMSYNIRNGRGMDDATDLRRVAEAIREARPDVVAVQEVDSATERSGRVDVSRWLGERVSLYHTYAPAIEFEGGKYGVAVLSRERPLRAYAKPLPGREEARVSLWVEFEGYIFCCTHLSLTEEDRARSLPLLREEAARAGKPVFVAGDWNDTPGSPFIRALGEDFRLLNDTTRGTYPASAPDRCIDYIAGYAGEGEPFTVLSSEVRDEPLASDHRPVVVDVRIGKKAR